MCRRMDGKNKKKEAEYRYKEIEDEKSSSEMASRTRL